MPYALVRYVGVFGTGSAYVGDVCHNTLTTTNVMLSDLGAVTLNATSVMEFHMLSWSVSEQIPGFECSTRLPAAPSVAVDL